MFEIGDIMRWVYGRIFGHPMNFSFIDENVAGSARPQRKKEVDWLPEEKRIGAILSVQEVPLNPSWLGGISYLHVPVRNHYPPTLEQMNECVNFIVNETRLGRKTMVHCAAGRGRTGTVLAAYLCYKYGLNASDAIKQIRGVRVGSIERTQVKAVHEYYEFLKGSDQKNNH